MARPPWLWRGHFTLELFDVQPPYLLRQDRDFMLVEPPEPRTLLVDEKDAAVVNRNPVAWHCANGGKWRDEADNAGIHVASWAAGFNFWCGRISLSGWTENHWPLPSYTLTRSGERFLLAAGRVNPPQREGPVAERAEPLDDVVKDCIRRSELPRALLSRDAGVGISSLDNWTAGRRSPTVGSAARLARGLQRRGRLLLELGERLEREALG
jgi:hypothetical protein